MLYFKMAPSRNGRRWLTDVYDCNKRNEVIVVPTMAVEMKATVAMVKVKAVTIVLSYLYTYVRCELLVSGFKRIHTVNEVVDTCLVSLHFYTQGK